MADDRIIAEYLVETPQSLAAAAESMAGEQSTGTFTRVPGETDELRERFAARVESIEELDRSAAVAARRGGRRPAKLTFQRGRVRISFPLESMGPNLPAIISTVAGNLFELRYLRACGCWTSNSPRRSRPSFPGPQFGSRRHATAHRRLRPADHRHDRQAERRPHARAKPPTWSARSATPASTSSKTTS